MIPNPLTPPQNISYELDESLYDAPTNPFMDSLLATPISLASMGEDASNARSDTREDSTEYILEDHDMSDEDDSEGGASLHFEHSGSTISLLGNADGYNHTSHLYDFGAEADELMADIYSYAESNSTPDLQEDSSEQNSFGDSALVETLPAALQGVVEHLQHLQEESTTVHFLANTMEDRFNLSLGDFLYNWATSSGCPHEAKRLKRPSLTELHAQRFPKELGHVKRGDLHGEDCDIQRMDWNKLGVSRTEARRQRRRTYKNYSNLELPGLWHSHLREAQLPDDQDYFRFRKMDFNHEVFLSHFQLRNLVSCASRDNVFYAGRSKIMQWNPLDGAHGPEKVAMNLTNPTVQPLHSIIGGIQISTLTVEHDILVAGGFCGEYALLDLTAHKSTKHTEGIVTHHDNSITNHLQVYLSRTSSNPQVAIASNDNGLRILDVATNRLVADHSYDYAINCSSVSPDGRLRVIVGDTTEVMICHSETGEILQKLKGHKDYGFACDWADDGWTVATGNQDQQILIWDARKWTNSLGAPSPVAMVAAEQAGIRKLKFSPLGSGKRVLVAAEPADFVNIIDAENFKQKQTLNFFGEIGGFDFSNGGQDLIVANCDSMRGGLMEFERCNVAGSSLYKTEDMFRGRKSQDTIRTGSDWALTSQEVVAHKSGWGTIEQRQRSTALLGAQMAHF